MSDQPQPPKPPKAPQQSVAPSGQNPVPQQAQPGAPVPAQAPAGSKGLSKGALWGISWLFAAYYYCSIGFTAKYRTE